MPQEEWSFMQVDVFADQALQGHPVAVFYDVPASSGNDVMQAVAREMHLPETVFVTACAEDADLCLVKIFTPTSEVPFAGHAAMGAYFVLRDQGLVGDGTVHLAASGETLACHAEGQQWIWMTAAPASVRSTKIGPRELAARCGMDAELISPMMPPAVARTNPEQMLLFVESAQALADLNFSLAHLAALEEECGVQGVYVLALTGAGSYAARYFSNALSGPQYTLAAGSSALALGSYLLCCAGETQPRRFIIFQGEDHLRPSEVHVRLNAQMRGSLEVGGQVVETLRGVVTPSRA